MRTFTRVFTMTAVMLLSSIVLFAQLQVSVPVADSKGLPLSNRSYDLLYEQNDGVAGNRASQDFETSLDGYDCEGADDFYVPAGVTWNIHQVIAAGQYSLTGPFDLANVSFYNDIGGVPDETAFASFLALPAVDNSGALTVELPACLTLNEGHYWVGFQGANDYGTYGQWYWQENPVIYGDQACWRNPGNGFASGYTTFTDLSTVSGSSNDFIFSLYGTSGTPLSCDYQVSLTDDYGDGWNGGLLDVFVNGSLVYDDLTVLSGYGPEVHTFTVTSGDEITTVYTAGSWSYENAYEIIDSEGVVVYTDGTGGVTPSGIGSGMLYANCPQLPGAIEGYVFNYDGLTVSGATIAIDGSPSTTSGPDGYYMLEGVPCGDNEVFCTKSGYNTTSAVVAVASEDTVQQDFTLTQPAMIVSPLIVEETVNPNEYYTFDMSVLNNGSGDLGWMAQVIYPEDVGGPHIKRPFVPSGTRAYCAASGGCDEFISNVTIGSINNSSGCTNYGDYTALSTEVVVGESYDITITNGNPIWTADECGIWVDWNQNEDFYDDPPITVSGSPGVGPYTATITVPEDAVAGPTRLRVRIDYANTPDPCGSTSFGEAEDYTVIVSGAGNWLTMDYYEGTVPPFGGVNNIPTHMDAGGTEAGEVYTADIVFTSTPDVGTITVPVTMIIAGDPLVPAEDLMVELTNDITGEVSMSWMWTAGSGNFQYFLIKRNGQVVATTTDQFYTDLLPDFGEYCYTVEAVYAEGSTTPAGPECVTWADPDLVVFPDNLEGWVWPDNQVTVYTTISNTGIGSLQFTFPDYVPSDFTCMHEVVMYDSFGDGWNGGTLTVFVNGSVVLNAITLSSGTGPESEFFMADGGDEITTTFVCGSFCTECSYEIYDGEGNLIADDGVGFVNPSGIGPGECFAFCPVPSFIVDVQPPTGIVPAGQSREIAITYDATGFPPGDYMEDLMLETNDPENLEFTIGNTMHVYLPAQYAGTVIDNNNSQGLPGVVVTAGPFSTTTDEMGMYSLLVDEGTYDVTFDKLGYQTVIVADTFAAQDMVTPIDVGMWDVNYPPAGVTATPNAADTECLVEWMLPQGPYEIQLDDGTAEEFALWQQGGSQNAVKFTPNGYPATVIGGRVYVGDGSFPAPFLGTEFGVAVYDDDGPDGMPGTMLDSGGVTVNNYGWVDFDWLSATITDGDFYLAMVQVTNAPATAPIGIDEDSPTYFMSYSKFQDQDWTMSAYQDFMMRAWVSGPQSDNSDAMVEGTELKYPAKPVGYGEHWYSMSGEAPHILPGVEKAGRYRSIEGMTSRDVVNYRVARYSNFDPNGSPTAGDLNELATTGGLSYNDLAFGGLPQGWYAYGVKALYTSGEYSDYAVSNIVGHLMDFEVTVNVTLTTGEDPINVDVMMQGLDWPYETYMATTPVSGTVVFDEVWLGNYSVTAYKIGYDEYRINSIFINEDTEINIVLAEKAYPPTNLYVDPLTLDATWSEPFITALMEDFEEAAFPPVGWQSLSDGAGWFRTDNGGSASFPIPTWDSYYACNNDDAAGSTNPGANDYLITPPMDLRGSPGFMMMFDSYYDGSFSQLAKVEYTTDGGATWEILYQLPPAGGAWQQIELDLEAFSGANGVPQIWFAFHADDAGQWASGWAVDNPIVQVPDPAANYIDFHVFLDGAFVGSTEETAWNYAPLTYGVEYEASVAARYTSGLSEKDYYTFLCVWLIPPRNLVGIAPDDAAILYWEPPLEPGGMFTVVSEEPRAEFPNVNSEYSPTVRTIEANTTGTRDPWDLQLSFATADNTGEAGAESDGDYLYTTMWNGSGFQQYELDGTYIGPLSAGGVGSLRDIAYDPTTGHMFGGAATSTINEMDLTAGTLIGTFTAPTDARAIAYDDVVDGFWANNWSTTITQFDKTGAQLNSFPVGSFGSYYGFAFDTWTEGGPFLWGFSQDGSGNVIVQIEVATGLETGFTQDVSGLLITGTGIAGGLFTHPNLVGNTVSIGGNSQNDVYFLYELAADGGPQPGEIPANLLGYNIYRFDEFVDYVSRDFLTYVDENLEPACYEYYVTGVYDLEPYGFPGEEGESMKEGPAVICVDYCFDLEFMEAFELGSYDPNNWDATGNWTINGQAGNPAPSAEFTWDPIQAEYEWGLTTYPLCGQGITEGDIWVDFNLKLESVNSTGEEYLHLQVWDWDSQSYTTVTSFSNIDGSFDWKDEHYKINSAKGKVFKVRFLAQGMNSLDILSWWVDNVHIYRTCESVTDVAAMEVGDDYDDIMVSWSLPSGGLIDEWIHWDTGMNTGNSIGTNSAVEFDVAARWEPDQISGYEGASITEVAFFPAEAASTYSIRIWTGGSLTGGPANLIVDQPVAAPLIGQWNYVALDTPPLLDVTQELWVGYYVNTTTGYPAGCDDGPSVDGYGNMMNFGGWQTLLQINPELDYNWNVQAHLQTLSGDDVTLPSLPMEAYEQSGTLELTSGNTVVQGVAASTANRILTGANVYRSVDGGEYEFLAFVAAPAQEYMDENITTPGILHCYMVTAVYESDIDFCESDYSDEACAFVTVGIGEQTAGAFRMYPNPATDYVMVTSSSDLQRISVYTAMGKLLINEEISGNEYELSTMEYTPGVYMVKIETSDGTTTELLNIQR